MVSYALLASIDILDTLPALIEEHASCGKKVHVFTSL